VNGVDLRCTGGPAEAVLPCLGMAPSAPPEDITRLLLAHHGGDREAFNRLVPAVYERLRAIAHGQLARGGRGDTLDTTALVHEAYVQLVDATQVPWQSRSHFFAICARVMRRIIVDFCRRRHAQKRGGKLAAVTLEPGLIAVNDQVDLVLAVDQALERLATFNERLARLVECRYFGGLTEEETAAALEISVRTVERDWIRARAWLQKELG
jgi:RNA polymerase sigma factor (TIGR02999 family)